MLKHLRIAVTALSLTACVLLIALWARSYWRYDQLIWRDLEQRESQFDSMWGQLTFDSGYTPFDDYDRFAWEVDSVDDESLMKYWNARQQSLLFGFGVTKTAVDFSLGMPHWFGVLVTAACGAILWRKRSLRFSLRTLFIAMTLVAVALGVIAFNSTERTAQPPIDVGDFGSPMEAIR